MSACDPKRTLVLFLANRESDALKQCRSYFLRNVLVSVFGVLPAAALCYFVLPLFVMYLGEFEQGQSQDSAIGIAICVGALIGTIALVFSVKSPPNRITIVGLVCGIAAVIGSGGLSFASGLWTAYFFASPMIAAVILIVEGIASPRREGLSFYDL